MKACLRESLSFSLATDKLRRHVDAAVPLHIVDLDENDKLKKRLQQVALSSEQVRTTFTYNGEVDIYGPEKRVGKCTGLNFDSEPFSAKRDRDDEVSKPRRKETSLFFFPTRIRLARQPAHSTTSYHIIFTRSLHLENDSNRLFLPSFLENTDFLALTSKPTSTATASFIQ